MAISIRKTARAIILTPQHDVLLMRVAFPWEKDEMWILPGGGAEDGEDIHATVKREIFEETGATEIEIVGEVWRQDLNIDATNTCLKQRYFLVHAERFSAKATKLSEPEMDWVREYRWWAVDALGTAEIAIQPRGIAEGIHDLISNGLPVEPIHIDGWS